MKFEQHRGPGQSSWPPMMAGDARLPAPSVGKIPAPSIGKIPAPSIAKVMVARG